MPKRKWWKARLASGALVDSKMCSIELIQRMTIDDNCIFVFVCAKKSLESNNQTIVIFYSILPPVKLRVYIKLPDFFHRIYFWLCQQGNKNAQGMRWWEKKTMFFFFTDRIQKKKRIYVAVSIVYIYNIQLLPV